MGSRTGDHLFKPGKPKPSNSGRRKGTPNRQTVELREIIRKSLDEAGGVDYLVWASRKYPAAYLSLVGRVIPQEIRAEIVTDVRLRTFVRRDAEVVELAPSTPPLELAPGHEVVDVTPANPGTYEAVCPDTAQPVEAQPESPAEPGT